MTYAKNSLTGRFFSKKGLTGKQMQSLRKKVNLSVAQLAVQIFTTVSAIETWEAGGAIGAVDWAKFALFLDRERTINKLRVFMRQPSSGPIPEEEMKLIVWVVNLLNKIDGRD